MKISETMPSSRSATFVSWGVLLTIRSLVMEGPFHEPSLAPAGLVAGRVVEERLCRRNGELGGARVRSGSDATEKIGYQARDGLSIGEAAHADVEDEADREKGGEHGGPPIAHERQGQPLDGDEA